MKQVKIYDKSFQLYIPHKKISAVVEQMADALNNDLAGTNPLFVSILNGSFMFAAELLKHIKLLDIQISFVKMSSYSGTRTTGRVNELIGLTENIEGRTVVVLEDIVDSGLTIERIREQLEAMNPQKVAIAALLLKPDALEKNVHLDYIGLKIPNDFIVGYGLDYNGYGRNLKDIYSIINE
jgi:hypoxanthine phosphoribosyltransferase